MLVLGINDGHDAGVCLMRDGRVVFAACEERRRNEKNFAGVPSESIRVALQSAGADPRDVDIVALSSLIRTSAPTRHEKPIYKITRFLSWLARGETATAIGRFVLGRLRRRKDLSACLAQQGLGGAPVMAFDHHLCHAATAFHHRPWSGPATVLTLDGAGDGLCATVSVGEGTDIRVISSTPKYHSPAAGMYSAVTAHLGLRPYEHEYKVMGMAPYGRHESCIDVMRGAFSVEGLKFRNHTGRFGPGIGRYFHSRLAGQRFDNVSAACQTAFEEMMVSWVRNAVAATGLRKVCAAGGAFLNVKANKLIREMPDVEQLSVYPASDDGGTPVGAAMLGHLQLCSQRGGGLPIDAPNTMHLGLEFDETQLRSAAEASGLPFRRMENPADEAAALLAAGKIIARFTGREELGPRALGNRSILADPRDLRVIRKLNFAIKQRDFWMPFAASVLQEDAERYIRNPTSHAHFMIEAFDSTPEGADRLIAGVHPFDLTIRPQLVDDRNPEYRDLIRAFKVRTGVGGLLNTSFNLHGFPIVGSPEVAIDTFVRSELDALALGPFLIEKLKGSN